MLPGNGEVIKSYVETLPKNQLTQLGVAGVGVNAGSRVVSDSSSIEFEWVGGGDFSVAATVAGTNGGSTTVYAGFFVQAPDVTVTATPINEEGGGTVASGTVITPVARGYDQLQMETLAWTGHTQAGWKYCFAQTANYQDRGTIPVKNPFAVANGYAPGTYIQAGRQAGLDGSFPYDGTFDFPDLAVNSDNPFIWILSGGGTMVFYVQAMTYYMCEPVDSAGNVIGGWVPLAELSWSYYVSAVWKTGDREPTIISSVGRVFGGNPGWSDWRDLIQATTFRPRPPSLMERHNIHRNDERGHAQDNLAFIEVLTMKPNRCRFQ